MGSHARRPQQSTGGTGLVNDWRSQPVAMRVLRAFLGVTFVYAGIQKFADPNFLHAGTPDYIGSQLQAFANGSPIAPVLRFFSHVPVLTGVGIALAEIAIGLGTLVGVAKLASSIGGLAISLVLFLSATWHVHPYFLGSDSMYAVAWLAYLAGLWEAERRRRSIGAGPGYRSSYASADLSRRQMLRGATVAGATLLLAGVGRALMGSPSAVASGFTTPRTGRGNGTGTGSKVHHPKPGHTKPGHPKPGHTKHAGTQPNQPSDPTTGPTTDPTTGPTTGSTSAPQGGGTTAPQGKTIATLDSLPVGGAIPFSGPGGEPCALFRLGQRNVAAFSRICTHAGCVVGYDSSSRLLVCPCHGAEFDPSRGAAPVAGPAPTPLQSIRVLVSGGDVVLPN